MSIKIITISRQFGSGGRTIAKTLAQKLGYDYYDKEIIENVAEMTGFSKEVVATKGEEAPGKSIFSYGFEAQAVPGIMNGMTVNDYIWTVQRKVIKDIADSGKPCVIVGRSADYILKDYNGAVALYNNEKIVTVYDGIVLSALPYADRARFTEGVRVESIEEADSIIEDYDG